MKIRQTVSYTIDGVDQIFSNYEDAAIERIRLKIPPVFTDDPEVRDILDRHGEMKIDLDDLIEFLVRNRSKLAEILTAIDNSEVA